MTILAERWRVVVENERVKGGDWPQCDDEEVVARVGAMPNFRANARIVSESGVTILQTGFPVEFAELLHHIADVHNGALHD